MSTVIRKLSSRKFWAAAVGVIMGIALAFGVEGDAITNVAGAVTSLVSIVAYIVAEAGIDKASASGDIYIESTTESEDEE